MEKVVTVINAKAVPEMTLGQAIHNMSGPIMEMKPKL